MRKSAAHWALKNLPVGIIQFNQRGEVLFLSPTCTMLLESIGWEELNLLTIPHEGFTSAVNSAIAGETGVYEGYFGNENDFLIKARFLSTVQNHEFMGIGIIIDLSKLVENEILDFMDENVTAKIGEVAGNRVSKRNYGQRLKSKTTSIQTIVNETVKTMVSILEKRDPYTAGHQQRVAQLGLAIAGEMKLPGFRRKTVHFAAGIHDIGKIQIPQELLSKPGRLTKLEMDLIKTHSQAGFEIIKSLPFKTPVAQTILQHHERMDGSGYPYGINGTEILLEARIVAVADVVEAMASHRPYRAALGIGAALEEISKKSGCLYDPRVAGACISVFEKGFLWDE